MVTVLVTGMSGTGKSAALVELARRGLAVVDTDEGDWIQDASLPDGLVEALWREDRIDALLTAHEGQTLFVAGCVANQGRFYPRFAAVALLTAPLDVMLDRVATRTANPFGRTTADRARITQDTARVVPLLRAGADIEIDTRAPLTEVADRLEDLARTSVPIRGHVRRSRTSAGLPGPGRPTREVRAP